jgi:hypothetical protein
MLRRWRSVAAKACAFSKLIRRRSGFACAPSAAWDKFAGRSFSRGRAGVYCRAMRVNRETSSKESVCEPRALVCDLRLACGEWRERDPLPRFVEKNKTNNSVSRLRRHRGCFANTLARASRGPLSRFAGEEHGGESLRRGRGKESAGGRGVDSAQTSRCGRSACVHQMLRRRRSRQAYPAQFPEVRMGTFLRPAAGRQAALQTQGVR